VRSISTAMFNFVVIPKNSIDHYKNEAKNELNTCIGGKICSLR
jgi:hypothetical protein